MSVTSLDRTHRRLLALAVGLLLLAAACGSTGSTMAPATTAHQPATTAAPPTTRAPTTTTRPTTTTTHGTTTTTGGGYGY